MMKTLRAFFTLLCFFFAAQLPAADITVFYEVNDNGNGTQTVVLYLRNNTGAPINMGAFNISIAYVSATSSYNDIPFSLLGDIWNPSGSGANESVTPDNVVFLPKNYSGTTYDQRVWYIVSSPLSGSGYVLGTDPNPTRALDVVFNANTDRFYVELKSEFSGNGIAQFPPFAEWTYEVRRSFGSFPVEWLSFEAHQAGPASVQLDWTTATETNNAYFQIERSLDGRAFTPVGEVAGAGNASRPQDYVYMDYPVESPVAFYRLRQVDFNGEFSHSEVRQVRMDQQFALSLSVYPNPVQTSLHLDAETEDTQAYAVTVTDAAGRILYHQPEVVFGTEAHTIDVSRYARGTYAIEVRDLTTGRNWAERFIKE